MSETKEEMISDIIELLNELPAEIITKMLNILETYGCTQESMKKIDELLTNNER